MHDRLPHEKGFHVSWDQLHRDARALAWRLDGHGPDDGGWRAVVAITRGGMAPAMIVARELDIRMVDTISVKSYNHQTQTEPRVIKSPDMEVMGDGTGVLIVDDLVDTGRTLEVVRAHIPRACRHGLCQAQGPAAGRHLHHRGQPGHLDLLPLGHGAAIRRTLSRQRLRRDGSTG